MENLPSHILDDILFRVDLRSLAMLRCSNKFLHSYIFSNPYFNSEYYPRVESGLLHLSSFSSYQLYYHSLGDSRPPRTLNLSRKFQILASCSGLLLVFVGSLFVANPLTKKFRFLKQPSLYRMEFWNERKYMGLAVQQIDQNTNIHSFYVVCMTEVNYPDITTYRFEVNGGDSWRLLELRLTCGPSQLNDLTRRPVYLDGYLHWLRKDGTIIAFNPETEQARVIPTKFPQELSSKKLFAAGDNSLTLISATEKVIDVYALKNSLTDPKWVLVRRIKNEVLDKKFLVSWEVDAYDGKCLVLRGHLTGRELYRYDLRANKWRVLGLISGFCNRYREFFQFIPSAFPVMGLDLKEDQVMKMACDDHISDLRSIMGLVIDRVR